MTMVALMVENERQEAETRQRRAAQLIINSGGMTEMEVNVGNLRTRSIIFGSGSDADYSIYNYRDLGNIIRNTINRGTLNGVQVTPLRVGKHGRLEEIQVTIFFS